jgi:hypothetical protein
MASSFSFETSENVFSSAEDFALRAGFELRILAIGEFIACCLEWWIEGDVTAFR